MKLLQSDEKDYAKYLKNVSISKRSNHTNNHINKSTGTCDNLHFKDFKANN
jgi:hypothetical protein